jgi:asparagine synthase (glutamine-hydrolysing)
MCGIAGFSGDFREDLLGKMSFSIAHRGPDDDGTFFDKEAGIGFAHRRLSIIDLTPAGHQPMSDAFEKAVIIYNGELYNYQELRAKLSSKGFTFQSASDTEVLLNLYLCYGEKMLDYINGIFAFAIWDIQQKQLFLARDQLGVKPLYYCQKKEGILFSSEMKAILADPTIDKTIDIYALNSYMTYLYSPAPKTLLKHVKKLEPGYALVIKDGTISRMWQYYDLPYNELPPKQCTLTEAIDQTEYHVRTAVHRQMISDVPVGTFLSGGLDSSTIAAFSRDRTYEGETLSCFTLGLSDDSMQMEMSVADLPYAQKVAKYLGVNLHTILVGPEIADYLEHMIYHLDEPQADSGPITTYLICKSAHEKGIKVLLSGTGGDDVFTGYRRHYALELEKYWSFLPVAIRKKMGKWSRQIPIDSPRKRRLAKAFKYAALEGDERIASYFHWIEPDRLLPLYSGDLQQSLEAIPFSQPFMQSLDNLSEEVHPLNRMLYLEGKHFLADHNLNYTDKMSMATGVEVRVPFLDIDLVKFASQLPVNLKQNGRHGKWILKKAMEKYLPQSVIYRPKCGFGTSLRFWIRNQLRDLVEDVLSEESINKRGLFNFSAIQQLREDDFNGRVDAVYTILSLMCVELWCRIFIDNSPPQVISPPEMSY